VSKEDHAEAKAALARGIALYNLQKYPEAIEQFEAGYQREPLPEFLFALGQAERLGGECARAIKSYQAFLRSRPNARQQEATLEHIHACEAAPSAPHEPSSAATAAVSATPLSVSTAEVHSAPVGPWLLGGAALTTIAAGATLRVWAQVDFNNLSHACKPSCAPSASNGVQAKELSGNILMVAGALASVADLALMHFYSPWSPKGRASVVLVSNGLALRGAF
jgi:tetratricopeptide (TPR) repeat protein